MYRQLPIELVDEELELGGGLRALITRPREPDRLLDEAVALGARDAPYWAAVWPAARALARALAPLELHGVRAVELGCGLALPSVAAALRGADVLAVDHDAAAVELACANGKRVGHVEGLVADLLGAPDELVARGPFDLVLAADVLYEEPLASALTTLVPLLRAPSGRVLVAFPWPGQADGLAASLARCGLRISFSELPVPGSPGARTIGLLEAS